MRSIVVATVLFAASCAGTSARAPSAAIPWSAMNAEEKRAFMEQVITPRMAAVFRAYSPHTYARFGCRSCHGEAADRQDYRMPNPDLPMTEGDVDAALGPNHERIAAFMLHDVDPAMARLLDAGAADADRHGTTCFRCHTRQP